MTYKSTLIFYHLKLKSASSIKNGWVMFPTRLDELVGQVFKDATILPHPVQPRKAVDLPERIPPQRIGHLGGCIGQVSSPPNSIGPAVQLQVVIKRTNGTGFTCAPTGDYRKSRRYRKHVLDSTPTPPASSTPPDNEFHRLHPLDKRRRLGVKCKPLLGRNTLHLEYSILQLVYLGW